MAEPHLPPASGPPPGPVYRPTPEIGSSEEMLAKFPLAFGRPRLLTSGCGWWDSVPHDLYVADLEGNFAHCLTRGPAREVDATWSPDGSAILYAIDRLPDDDRDDYDVVILPLRTMEPRLIAATGANEADPSWSPDGESILYVSDASGRQELWMADRAGGRSRRISSGGGMYPAWSPDGSRIAYLRPVTEYFGPTDLCVLDVAGCSERVIRKGVDCETQPEWDPSGRHVCAVSYRAVERMEHGESVFVTEHVEFIVVDVSSGRASVAAERTEFIDGKVPSDLAWSPDGKWIACLYRGDGAGRCVAVVGLATHQVTEVEDTNAYWPIAPQWMPGTSGVLCSFGDVHGVGAGRVGRIALPDMSVHVVPCLAKCPDQAIRRVEAWFPHADTLGAS